VAAGFRGELARRRAERQHSERDLDRIVGREAAGWGDGGLLLRPVLRSQKVVGGGPGEGDLGRRGEVEEAALSEMLAVTGGGYAWG
jgi:hypothetical protein